MVQAPLSKIVRQTRPQGIRRRADFTEVVPREAGKQHVRLTNLLRAIWPATSQRREFAKPEFERELASETRGQRGGQVKPLDGRNNIGDLDNTWKGSVQAKLQRTRCHPKGGGRTESLEAFTD